MIHLMVNGEERSAPKGVTVFQYLEQLGADPSRVVVEVNREILSVNRFPSVTLQEGDVVEIVIFVGGGD